MTILLTRDQILAIPLRTKEIYIPEWNGSILIREMTAREMMDAGLFVLKRNGETDYTKAAQAPAYLFLKHVIDRNGNREFPDEDIEKVNNLHGAVVQRIAKEVQELSSGVSTSADDDSKNAIENAEENFTKTQSDDSSSN
jgi:hypothetical protein